MSHVSVVIFVYFQEMLRNGDMMARVTTDSISKIFGEVFNHCVELVLTYLPLSKFIYLHPYSFVLCKFSCFHTKFILLHLSKPPCELKEQHCEFDVRTLSINKLLISNFTF